MTERSPASPRPARKTLAARPGRSADAQKAPGGERKRPASSAPGKGGSPARRGTGHPASQGAREGRDSRDSGKSRGAAAAVQGAARQMQAQGLPTDSLAFALDTAVSAIGAVRNGAALPAALQSAFQARAASARHADVAPEQGAGDWRGAAQDIAYRTIRALGLTDALIATMVPKPPSPAVRDLLACALTLLVAAVEATRPAEARDARTAAGDAVPASHSTAASASASASPSTPTAASTSASSAMPASDTSDAPAARIAPYAAHTVVDQAVRAAAAAEDTRFASGMTNAVLRSFLRDAEALLQRVQTQPVARWRYPQWWIDAVRRAWPTQWQAILAAGNQPAPMTLRVNARHASPQAYLATLAEAGIAAHAAGASGVRLARALPVNRLPGFAEGTVSVQDAGAQRAAVLLDVRDGMRVLDACAAPGGKTGHLLELADIDLVALESDAARAPRITENLQRLDLRADVRIGDAARLDDWWDGTPFDRVLADVPCSASGIVRRHPDIRWLRRAADIPALVQTQRRILNALWKTVAVGGELLYVTCSIFPEEGEEQARWFEGACQDAVRLEAPGQLTPVVAASGSDADHDGFFYARFRKR